jgi:hypothetical protein
MSAFGHEPIDLVPSGGDSGGDGVAQHVDDRPHEVVVHHLVLVGADAKGGMFVRDARQQAFRNPLAVEALGDFPDALTDNR